MDYHKIFLFVVFLCFSDSVVAQQIPYESVLSIEELSNYLKKDVRAIISKDKKISEAELAAYFRQKFSERFFYDWKTVNTRFTEYTELYDSQKSHINRANDHMSKYPDSTQWILPFNYQNGEAVNAYALRHLARQHKMVDIAYLYFYENKDPKYIRYFTNQMQSLNAALVQNKVEPMSTGNGVYEVFRAGYRVLNWLSIHNLFLGEEAYSDADQLYTVATMLQHAADLYENNPKFKSGNHQTRGMSALAMLSIIFSDFEDADLWYERSMTRLGEHLSKEINDDGFQFERTVHYHMSDIGNYFYVYQLAKISDIKVDQVWENKLRSLFETLAKIAFPDRTAPVLQDDTRQTWAERNEIGETMALGYMLFEDPRFGYFAKNKVSRKMYWFLQQKQLNTLQSIEQQKPEYGSLLLAETGYGIMREGWEKGDKMMIISAGLDEFKPDHQHGDMLGIQAVANGKVILPNYQVRYPLADLDLFKNSLVKNVALVDDELQGKKWTTNKGKSGFGKFKELPNPKIIAWESNNKFDFFVGSHDGFSNKNVEYSRQLIFVKDQFWIVKDNFRSDAPHTYKQVWQRYYSDENAPNLLRSSFSDGSGCDIFQLRKTDSITQSGKRGKAWSIVEKKGETNFSFITAIVPFKKSNDRIDETEKTPTIGNWKTTDLFLKTDAEKFLIKKENAFLFEVSKIENENVSIEFSEKTDVFVVWKKDKRKIQSIGEKEISMKITGGKKGNTNQVLKPGEKIRF